MASISKKSTGWRAEIYVNGKRECKTLATKNEAVAWAADRESALRKQNVTGINKDQTCQDAFDRYLNEVSIHKRGERWEKIRLNAIAKHKVGRLNFGDIKLCDLTSDMLGQWRDMRLKTISGASVNREITLLSHVFTTARREWKWLEKNPLSDVRRAKGAPPRDRLISSDEIERICFALDYTGEVKTKSHAVATAFLFAIETAMRAGEICALKWEYINNTVAVLPPEVTKNGTKRDVPLSARALELLNSLPRDRATCFDITSASLDTLFRKARDRVLIENLNFHDTRHEAITRLAKKLNVLDLARMVGHRDLRMLQVYYNETAEEIAKKL
jgi:integrase